MADNDDDVLKDFLPAVLSAQFEQKCVVVTFPNTSTVPQISNLESLTRHLPEICSNIFKTLGSQQCEKTYHRCLKVDLEQAGLKVEIEKEIRLVYKDKIVGTRRADIIVTFPSNKESAVMELKAVTRGLYPAHAKQLKYYMNHLHIDHGYLINFPHDEGFPDIPDSAFDGKSLQGFEDASTLDGHYLRLKNDPASNDVQVIEFQRRRGLDEQEVKTNKATEQEKAAKPHWGITNTGKPCAVCIKQKRFCYKHTSQAVQL
jgi:GxxExxY protein